MSLFHRFRVAAFGLPAAAGVLALVLATAPAPAQAQGTAALTPAQQDAVRALVRDTLVNNPDILREAFGALQAQEEAATQARQREALSTNAQALFNDPTDPVMGNPDGDITLVEFSDYRCSYCKAVMDTVIDVVGSDGNVRFVLKEFPILGADSVLASRFALAAMKQGAYEPYHQALMKHRGTFNEAIVLQIARDVGLDADRLKRDAGDPAIQQKLLENRQLAESLGIGGTPAFVIGDVLLPGAVKADTLRQAIAQARAKTR